MSNPLIAEFGRELTSYLDIETYIHDILEIDWLFPPQIEVLKKFYENGENGIHKYNELIMVAGMRSGKTIIGSVISSYEGYKLLNLRYPCRYYQLPAGQDLFILNIATSERQAKDTVFSQIRARVDNSDWWKSQNYIEHHNEFIFKAGDCNIIFRSEHSNSASLAGKTNKCVVLDETARFKDTGGKLSGKMVYDTVSRGVRTFGHDGILVSISSPIYDDDFQMQLYKTAIKKKPDGSPANPSMLGLRYATWELNFHLTKEILEPEFQKDPEAAWRDFGARPSKSLEAYCREPWRVDRVMKKERFNVGYLVDDVLAEREDEAKLATHVMPNKMYFMGGDPAFKNDAFGFAMGHWEYPMFVYDIVWRFKPDLIRDLREIDTVHVRDFITMVSQYFPTYGLVVDTWQYPETIQSLRQKGVNVVQHIVDKETYDMLKESVYSVSIVMPEFPIFKEEFTSLELKRGTKIDHPRKGSKDVSDAVANCLYLAKTNVGIVEEPIFAAVEGF